MQIKLKKVVYVFSTILFLIVLAFFVYQIMFLFYVSEISFIASIGVVCVLGGIGLGLFWWDIVYIQGKHCNFKIKNTFK
tara:strand:- start:91 stop:327 length:237 start_codon:yes stop_codon:yes gene_type:complete